MSTPIPPRPEPDAYPIDASAWRTRPRHVLLILAVLALLLAAVLFAVGSAAADGPVIWKMHCPRWYDVQIVPDAQGDGVHALCIMQSAAAEK